MVVATQPKNKGAHPGRPDLPSPKQCSGQSKVSKGTQQRQHDLAVTAVATLETELLTAQQNARENARQPAGPGISKNAHGQTTGPVSSQQSSVNSANSGTGMYNCYTIRIKYTNVSMIATVSLRHNDEDDEMVDTMVVLHRHLIDACTGNQTEGMVATLQCDEHGLITNGVACIEDKNGGSNEMESIDGVSDSKKSKQNLKVSSPNLILSVLHLCVPTARKGEGKGGGWYHKGHSSSAQRSAKKRPASAN